MVNINDILTAFYRLYPGKADVINDIAKEALNDAKAQGLGEKETRELVEGYLLADL